MSQLPIGALAPDFELNDLKGNKHSLSNALAQGPVALVFYKSACPTCQFSFPYIEKMFSRAERTKGLTLWGISQDDAEETRAFAKALGITFDLLLDEEPYDVSAAFGLEFVPALFLIQSDGKISISEYGFTKSGLNGIIGVDFFTANDGLPARRPG
jgi:peroxiredoxin